MNTKITKKEDEDTLKAFKEYMKISNDNRICAFIILLSLSLMLSFNVVMMYFR